MRKVFYPKKLNNNSKITVVLKNNKRMDISYQLFEDLGNLWLQENMRAQILLYAAKKKLKLSPKNVSKASEILSIFLSASPPENEIQSAINLA